MKKVKSIIFGLIMLGTLTGCASTDVLRTYSEKSLNQIVTNFKDVVKEDNNQYILSIDNTNSLIVKKDFSASREDVVMKLDAIPFINAGISETNIPKGYRIEDNSLVIPTDFGKGEKDKFLDAFFLAVDNKRDSLSYHKDLDHYGVALYGGNKFEFAKDCKTNDKDIVFVLVTKPLTDLGINVKKIDGWVFKTIKQVDGTTVDVIVKPYDMEMEK